MSDRYSATRVAAMMAKADAAMGVGSGASIRRAEELLDEASLLVETEYGSTSVDHMMSICDHVEMQVVHDLKKNADDTIRDNDLDECVMGLVNGGELTETPGAMDLVRRYAGILRSLGDADASRQLLRAAEASKRASNKARRN
jgi:hypothetical protein